MRLIDAEELIAQFERDAEFEPWDYSTDDAIRTVKSIPDADVVYAKWGSWFHYEGFLQCSECGMEFYDDIMEWCGDNVPKFCPNCGADMRER